MAEAKCITGDVTIRPIRIADYEAVVALWAAADLATKPHGRDGRPAFLRQLGRFPRSYLLAEARGEVVGVVLGSHDERKGWINRLAVHPAWRRRGVARRLLGACEAALHGEGIGIVAALVETGNTISADLLREAEYLTDVPVLYFRKLESPTI